MRTFDLTPLYRSTVGFDRVFDLLDTAGKAETGGYPPYNIERLERKRLPHYTLAVAGFSAKTTSMIEILHENTLTVTGKRRND